MLPADEATAHGFLNAVPHLLQNFRPPGFSLPHFEQRIGFPAES